MNVYANVLTPGGVYLVKCLAVSRHISRELYVKVESSVPIFTAWDNGQYVLRAEGWVALSSLFSLYKLEEPDSVPGLQQLEEMLK